MKETLKNILIVSISFILFHLLWVYYLADIRRFFDSYFDNISVSHALGFVVIGIPVYLGIILINGNNNFFNSLGLKGGFIKGFVFAFIATLPMLIGYTILNDFNPNFDWHKFIRWGIIAAIVEEFFYRGFLFGQIFRKTKLGFILSILVATILFALSHAHQSQDISRLIGIFITTGLASVLFAWIYIEWNYNLWTSIFLHLFMNVWWILFPTIGSSDALGNLVSNIFRVLSIVLVVVLTVVYKRKHGLNMTINKKTLWIRKKSDNKV